MKSFALGVAAALALAGFVPAAFASPVAGIVATAAAAQFFVAQNGVALSQFPSRSRLATAVLIGTTQPVGTPGRWNASSSAAWLSVTRMAGRDRNCN